MSKEPNYKLMFKSAVSALKSTYLRYEEAIIENIRLSGITDDGKYFTYVGVEKRNEHIKELQKEVFRLMDEVEKYRRLKDETND